MKIRIREGNDFDVAWAIKRAGVPEDLSTAINMKLTLVVYGLVIEHNLFTVTDNVLSINIPKEVATVNGDYRLIFEYTLPDAGQPDGDLKCKTDVVPFRIVPFTAKADDIYTINVTSDVAIGLKGDKGDDGADAYQIWLDLGNEGTYEDFIAYLRQPAVDAGASISELEGEIQVSEDLRVQAENERVQAEVERQTTIQEAVTATQEAVTATQEATTAASLADAARLGIQDDLALKADHGYETNPKTLKQVDDDLVQLAGDVNRKVDFIIPKNNLLNRNTELPNSYVYWLNGGISPHATNAASDWIEVEPNTNYYGNYAHYAWYDENRVYISGEDSGGLKTSPSTAKYIRISYTPGNIYLVKGSSAVAYEEFRFIFDLLEINTSQLKGLLQEEQTSNFRKIDRLIETRDTNFFFFSKNLFNKETYIPDAYVNQTTGVIEASSTNWASDYIKVQGGLPYYGIGINRIAWYDANKAFISGEFQPTAPLIAPTNAEYIRFSRSSSISPQGFQFEQNTEATTYEPFYERITRDSIAVYIDGVYRKLNDKIEADGLDILERNKNLFIQETVTLGHYVAWSNGYIQTNLTYNASDFMPVEPDTDYFNNINRHYALYDENKVFIEGKQGSYGGLIHTPVNAAFARISVLPKEMGAAQFEKGSLETSYVKGGYTHKSYITTEPSPVSLPVTEIVMPPKYVAVVGSPIQIFYHGLIKAIDPYKYNLRVNCVRGKDFRRYWEFTPQSTDVGTHTLTLSLYDDANNQISTASTQIEVVEFVQNPAVKKNILTVGDSLNNGAGDWGDAFAKQVVDGTNILPGLSPISNIDFVGEDGVAPKQYTGWGGWSWSHYNIAPNPSTADIWVYTTHDKDTSDQESLWSDTNSNIWQLETIESTRLKFKRYGGHTAAMPASPNALIHNLNAVHTATINYTSIQVAEQNPFWNASTSEVDFVNWFSSKYPTKHSNGEGIDACFVMLGWNGAVYGKLTEADWDAYILTAKTFIDNLHSDYPSCKVYVMGLQYPSLNGGLGNSYGAKANHYAELWSVMQSVQSLNKAYEALCDDAIYSSFCKFINISGQFDSEFNMPYSTTPVNLRSSITERRGNNGVHPSVDGYMQISDAAIRMLIKEFCQ